MANSSGKLGIVFLSVWLTAGAGVAPPADAQQRAAPEPQAQHERVVPESQVAVKQSFAPVVKKAAPAVVNVYVQHTVQQIVSPFGDDPFFSQLFGERFGIPRERIQNSLGSGVLVDPSGLVVTNNHVIQGGGEAEITVALSDGREFPAKVVLKDEHTDLAVLRLDAKGAKFPVIEFADSDSLEVGDLVLAIGDPFGVGQTVTSGIVSALARTQVGISDYQFFIQTDAAINPGNSGGALVDMDGKLAGINTAIFSRSGGSHGIGFAIPSNMVRLVVQSALKGVAAVQRPWLGATLQPVTSDIADSLGLPTPSGALVAKVAAKGPAAKAGLAAGDVVIGVDGKEVKDPQAFDYRFLTKGIGGTAELTLLRKGQKMTTTIALLAPVEDPPRDARELTGHHPLSGCKVANLSPAVAQELGVDDDTRQGVVVLDVKDDTPAARIGVQRGDIVVSLNNEKVSSVAQLAAALDLSGDRWRLSVERDGKVFNLAISG
ncbi:MAG TPA: Do family serine endopeptidase [Methyloceanibacter sp.]|nr:Do family serine endopeptidase [Methyloceanibacter sp.]HZP07773.1 Do family serine endopeptidase [Methyloceanibacter sp.]